MRPTALLVHVDDWEAGFSWYREAFPGATIVELPEFEFRALRIGNFIIEIVRSDEKVPSGKAGTILYPEITTKFWFTKSSGRLALGKKIRWDWGMFGVGDSLTVKEFEENRRILIQWESDPTTVEWRFEAHGHEATLVKISNWGFVGDCDSVLPQAIDAKGGYSMVLAGLKVWLEYGIELNLVREQFPSDHSV